MTTLFDGRAVMRGYPMEGKRKKAINLVKTINLSKTEMLE